MNYTVSTYYNSGVKRKNCGIDYLAACESYHDEVERAYTVDCIEAVALTRGSDPSCLLKRWSRRDKNKAHVKFGYKIHGVCTANDKRRSANTAVFYETEDEALRAAENMVKRAGQSTEGVVIYKAFRVVRPLEPQVVIEDVEV